MEGEGEVSSISPVWPEAIRGVLSVCGPLLRAARSTETEGGLLDQTSVLLTVEGPRYCSMGEGRGGLERGGKRGGEGMGSHIEILLGNHSMNTPGLDLVLVNPVSQIGWCPMDTKTNNRGRRGRKKGWGK